MTIKTVGALLTAIAIVVEGLASLADVEASALSSAAAVAAALAHAVAVGLAGG